ncbi:hypothetical protein Avbf_08536, partial [Armadillidium vulgare]
MFFSLLRIF